MSNYEDKYADQIQEQFYKLEDRICADIIRRIKKTGSITSTADWQITRLYQLGYSSAEIEDMIRQTLKATYPDVFELYDEVLDWEYVRNRTLYEQINAEYIPFEDNGRLQQILQSMKSQTQGTLQNLTQTMGVVQQVGGQMTFLPLTQFYQQTLDAAVLDIVSGAFDYNSVLKRTVEILSRSGIRSIDYASGASSRIAVAARRAIKTGVKQMRAKVSEYNAEKLGTEYFEIDRHSGARPTHRPWQGKVWSKSELESVCGLGTVTGLNGVNCYHVYYPFIPGISKRKYTDEELKRLDALDDEKKPYKGKGYDAYEARQKQRQMETAMRAQRAKVRGLERGGADPDDITIAKARYQGQIAEYKQFSDAMGLKPQMKRVYIDGLGRVAMSGNAYKKMTTDLERVYNKGNVQKNLNALSRDRRLQAKLKNGQQPLHLNSGKQGKHIQGHNNYIEGRSYLTVSEEEAQRLVYKNVGTGWIVRDAKERWSNKEVVELDRVVGVFVDPATGDELQTNRITIHYSKTGVHIVPARPKGGQA